jgi:hypothetical protein
VSHLILKKERKKEGEKKTRLVENNLMMNCKVAWMWICEREWNEMMNKKLFFHLSKISNPINYRQKNTLHNKCKQQQNTK